MTSRPGTRSGAGHRDLLDQVPREGEYAGGYSERILLRNRQPRSKGGSHGSLGEQLRNYSRLKLFGPVHSLSCQRQRCSVSTCKHISCLLLLFRRRWKARAFCKTQSPSLDILSTVLPVRASVRPCVRASVSMACLLMDG